MFGLLLLFGLIAAASIGVFVVATDGFASTQSSAENDRIEQSFVHLGSQAATVGRSSQDVRTVDFDLAGGEAIRKEASGHVRVTVSGDDEPLVDEPMTSIEYRREDEVIAYQAGGVWKGTGEEARMLSAPDVAYEPGMLTLPIMNVTGDRELGSDRLTLRSGATKLPLSDLAAVDGKVVTVTVESEYYAGWAEYFERRTTDAAVDVDHGANTVRMILGVPELEGDYEDAVVAQGSVATSRGNACIDGDVTASGTVTADDCSRGPGGSHSGGDDVTLRPIDEAIDLSVDLANRSGDSITGDWITNGTYFVDGDLHLDRSTGDLTVDVSSGDVAIVVDGHVALDGQRIRVVGTGSGHAASVYATGDIAVAKGGSGVTVDGDRAERFHLFGTSQMHFAMGQGSFTGTVYAPREESADGTNEAVVKYGLSSADNCAYVDGEYPDVCIGQGSAGLTGSITSGPMSVEQRAGLVYDDDLAGTQPRFALEGVVMPPELTYLHVVVHDVAVTSE